MDEQFIRNRISELRGKKGISEYRMSMELGHSKSYMQSISSGKALPSLGEFLSICNYLEVTPSDFFDGENREPQKLAQLSALAGNLDSEELELLIALARRLQK